ncbi:hypothetical protein CBR_g38440 [Chara braunii]|uniref:C2H2-type domain-containing protein n=1 Tax=Chara braunii TaxID=69332 RepID=A0A388JNP7_CHABU|nr:hypothetical protein CBR_g38440 [Chara braunii]|eukprot:GBG59414.1 hypothetical protein CBR_g38440 [Chara braunii]
MSKPDGVDNTFRRKWDKAEYAERARERERKEEEEEERRFRPKFRDPPVQRKPLKPREHDVDLTSRLGKTQVVTQVAPLSQQAGFYCDVCECIVKDSANYLDHINGKKREYSQNSFQWGICWNCACCKVLLRTQLMWGEKAPNPAMPSAPEATDEGIDPEMAAVMGFGGFGSSKK